MTATIFALATAPGRAALAVVRISGPLAGQALLDLSGRRPTPRRATLVRLADREGVHLDEALAIRFAGPASYTGEDVVELHLHGGHSVVEGVTAALAAMPGLRRAEPGEFTRRALENGRMDLTQAEAVADLIDAETRAQRRQALDQLDGAMTRRHERWRSMLLEALTWIEASVDFPDEDLPELLQTRVAPVLDDLTRELDSALAGAVRGRRVRDGYRVALVGAPNAGKSTLLNGLARRDAAIVTPIAGTTRDVVEVSLSLAGFAVVVADTAGLRETDDLIEAEGVRRATNWASNADLRVWLVDGSNPQLPSAELVQAHDLQVWTKRDLASPFPAGEPERIDVDARSARDVARIEAALEGRVIADLTGSEFPAATRARHVESLDAATKAIRRARQVYARPELAALEVQNAIDVLHRVTGRIGGEQVLDQVFASFCIGK